MRQLLTTLLLITSVAVFGQSLIDANGQLKVYLINNHRYLINTPTECVLYATDFGFHPDSSASDNVLAWNSMPDGCTIYVDGDGTYLINGTCYLRDNTTYIWTGTDTVRETGTPTTYCHAL